MLLPSVACVCLDFRDGSSSVSSLQTEPLLHIWGLPIVRSRVLRVWLAMSTVTPTMLERPWCDLSSFLSANSVCALPLPLRQPAPEEHGL
ncbi:hypothetical protein N665_1573s0008 [Sinapis alba]|nr:hypothetical protein N665_1573s0008 [Sinapis alba]